MTDFNLSKAELKYILQNSLKPSLHLELSPSILCFRTFKFREFPERLILHSVSAIKFLGNLKILKIMVPLIYCMHKCRQKQSVAKK